MHSLRIFFAFFTERIEERKIKARPAQPHLRVRGCFLSENSAMPPGQQVKVHKSARFVDIWEVCKFTT